VIPRSAATNGDVELRCGGRQFNITVQPLNSARVDCP
jgi:hypothetical protein